MLEKIQNLVVRNNTKKLRGVMKIRSIFNIPKNPGISFVDGQKIAGLDLSIELHQTDDSTIKAAVKFEGKDYLIDLKVGQSAELVIEGKKLLTISKDPSTGKLFIIPNRGDLRLQNNFTHPDLEQLVVLNASLMQDLMTDVAELEQDESRVNSSTREGYQSFKALIGFSALCELFLLTKFHSLTNSERVQILEVVDTLLSASEESEAILKIESECLSRIRSVKSRDKFETEFAKNIEQVRKKIQPLLDLNISKLLKSGVLNNAYGFGTRVKFDDDQNKTVLDCGHHEMMTIRFNGNSKTGQGRYTFTIYNAGYGVEFKKENQVSSRTEYLLNATTLNEFRDFLEAIYIRRILGIEVTEDIEKNEQFIESNKEKVLSSYGSTPQTRGNCTTRSTREFIGEKISHALFSEIYRFASDPARLIDEIDRLNGVQSQNVDSPRKPKLLEGEADARIQNLLLRSNLLDIVQILNRENVKALYKHKGALKSLGHIAVETNSSKLLEAYLNAGMTGSEADALGNTVLVSAIEKGKTDLVQIILDHAKRDEDLSLPSIQTSSGVSPLKAAIDNERLDILEALIQAGADASVEANDGYCIPVMLIDKFAMSTDENEKLKLAGMIVDVIYQNPNFNIHQVDGNNRSFRENFSLVIPYMSKLSDKAKADKVAQYICRKNVSNLDRTALNEILTFFINGFDEAIKTQTLKILNQFGKDIKITEESELLAHYVLDKSINNGDESYLKIFKSNINLHKFCYESLSWFFAGKLSILDDEAPTIQSAENLKKLFENIKIADAQKARFMKIINKSSDPEKIKIFTSLLEGIKIKDVDGNEPEQPKTTSIADLEKARKSEEQKKVEKIRQHYNLGDILRGVLSFVIRKDLTRGEDSYHFGDLTRSALSWLTSDSTWKRPKINDPENIADKAPQSPTSEKDRGRE